MSLTSHSLKKPRTAFPGLSTRFPWKCRLSHLQMFHSTLIGAHCHHIVSTLTDPSTGEKILQHFHGFLEEKSRAIFHPRLSFTHLDVSKNGGTQQPWVFLLKMIILGCFGGTPISGNTHLGNLSHKKNTTRSRKRLRFLSKSHQVFQQTWTPNRLPETSQFSWFSEKTAWWL